MTEQNLTEVTEEGLLAEAPVLTGRQVGFAVTSLVLGILSVLTLSGALILSILAVSFAIAARDRETKKMCKRAKAGLILGIVGIVLMLLGVGSFFLLLYLFVQALGESCAGFGESLGQNLADSINQSLSGGCIFPHFGVRFPLLG